MIYFKIISIVATSCFLFVIACIHTKDEETVHVGISDADKEANGLIQVGEVGIGSVIYTPVKLPLENFFSQLASGSYTEAFNRFDLRYYPSKSDNKAISELLNAGFVPVYVEMINHGEKPINYAEENFFLSDGVHHIPAISAMNLPREFKRFNFVALGANVYNTGVVVLGVAALMAILIGASKNNNNNLFFPSSFGNPQTNTVPSDKVEKNQIYNNTTKKMTVDYHDYLLSKGTVSSEKPAKGLLFFRTSADLDKLHLQYIEGTSSATL